LQARESQFGADGPQVGEERLEERPLEVFDAGRAARAWLRADGSLDHLDVPVAPLLQALVQIDEQLADLRLGRVIVVDADKQAANLLGGRIPLAQVSLQQLLGDVVSAAPQVEQER